MEISKFAILQDGTVELNGHAINTCTDITVKGINFEHCTEVVLTIMVDEIDIKYPPIKQKARQP